MAHQYTLGIPKIPRVFLLLILTSQNQFSLFFPSFFCEAEDLLHGDCFFGLRTKAVPDSADLFRGLRIEIRFLGSAYSTQPLSAKIRRTSLFAAHISASLRLSMASCVYTMASFTDLSQRMIVSCSANSSCIFSILLDVFMAKYGTQTVLWERHIVNLQFVIACLLATECDLKLPFFHVELLQKIVPLYIYHML